jgi:ribosomal protein S27E
MALHVDISARELDPSAVLEFIRRHTVERPSQNLLFKVNEETFRLHQQELVDVVAVSPEEAAELNAELGLSASPADYLISGQEWRCSNCGRYLTFYDVFQSGKPKHDNDFFRVFLATEAYHVQVARENSQLDVNCTNCGTINKLTAPAHYTGPHYTYA